MVPAASLGERIPGEPALHSAATAKSSPGHQSEKKKFNTDGSKAARLRRRPLQVPRGPRAVTSHRCECSTLIHLHEYSRHQCVPRERVGGGGVRRQAGSGGGGRGVLSSEKITGGS